ncbi:FxDxF family PEP-CTERM protein [Paucibacter sp. TC2R-5]|uniref:FxDxF family PEP-CTERM protein n=1 Tax=Paucibacter sp. TC2R-5 TaxID=2893555 RepID=UPI0021E3A73A|nr:FxDxF family PEP-CTERM protein [Paucibacter sp. TC2R-5]MCV2361545.1 FxDxF family PEP-CTERM protein [Paucibacter sp. TC2R-5]
MKKLNFVAAALLAVSSFASSAASVNLGSVTFDGPEFATFAKGNLTGAFDLFWTFQLDQNSKVSSSVTSQINGIKDVDFTSVYLTDGSNTVAAYENKGTDASEQWVLNSVALNSNVTYQIHTVGTAYNKAGFAGELSVTAVPEPTTYALLLAGLGAVGFVARRRKAA